LQSAEYVEAALQACGSTLVATGPAEELSKALTSLASHWHKWAEAPADLAGPLIPDDLRIQWELALQRVELSRGGLNQLITKYNEAINQYPARLLARVVGFRAAGTIRAI
jgi:LemA protein